MRHGVCHIEDNANTREFNSLFTWNSHIVRFPPTVYYAYHSNNFRLTFASLNAFCFASMSYFNCETISFPEPLIHIFQCKIIFFLVDISSEKRRIQLNASSYDNKVWFESSDGSLLQKYSKLHEYVIAGIDGLTHAASGRFNRGRSTLRFSHLPESKLINYSWQILKLWYSLYCNR